MSGGRLWEGGKHHVSETRVGMGSLLAVCYSSLRNGQPLAPQWSLGVGDLWLSIIPEREQETPGGNGQSHGGNILIHCRDIIAHHYSEEPRLGPPGPEF